MEKTKINPWILSTMFFVALLGCFVVYWIYTTGQVEIEQLRQKNKYLENRYDREKAKNDSLLQKGLYLEFQADSIMVELEKSRETYQQKLQEYERRKNNFKNLPTSVRDSLIREYIRANQ
jgi:hypothetical protein